MSAVSFAALDAAGLSLQAVFDVAALPAAVRATLAPVDPVGRYRQLLLVGHGGRRLWECLQAQAPAGDDPIDDYSVATVRAWFADQLPGRAFELLYPGPVPLGLQALGEAAGWHHRSPFRVGINATWGSWFAYRVVALADAALTPTPPLPGASPCDACSATPCIVACPADALRGDAFSLPRCLAYRQQPDSRCALTCIARTRCPVRPEHRYDDAQIAHSYSRSLAMIRRYAAGGDAP